MNNLKTAREKAGLSQKEVSVELKVSAPTVSEWESGKKNPNAENLKALSKLYKVPTDYLLGHTNNDLYVEPNGRNLRTTQPISILAAQYHVSEDIMSSITGANKDTVQKWMIGSSNATDEEYAALSNFFEIPIADLKSGLLPLFPKESVQLRVLELTDIRYAAYGKAGDFSVEEIQKIKDFADMVRRARGNRIPEE